MAGKVSAMRKFGERGALTRKDVKKSMVQGAKVGKVSRKYAFPKASRGRAMYASKKKK